MNYKWIYWEPVELVNFCSLRFLISSCSTGLMLEGDALVDRFEVDSVDVLVLGPGVAAAGTVLSIIPGSPAAALAFSNIELLLVAVG